ncbi:hypothetical protein [Lentzea aerocolonigenes]|uniref:hypothetical protein n=1 Tax=Lentzea aerocolonigenes TaxID=68170 RepID=UPI0004C3BD94|nr:hypothetical protein [Lentzea aerocolonigenes]MCP2246978.1 hypothetical protein [Lentzea aerocolonigenes]
MAGAVGIVFGLCVLSFTLGAALMYVVLRRREDAASPSPSDEPVERTWVEKPALVEPVEDDYDSRPIHRNPVVGLPQLEPALSVLAAPVAEPEAEVEPEPEPEPAEVEPEAVEVESEPEPVEAEVAEAEVEEPEPEPDVVVEATLPPPAEPQPVEHTTWVEREDFRQRYLRTFEEVRRKAGSN